MRTQWPARFSMCLLLCMVIVSFSGCLREKDAPLVWSDFLEPLTTFDYLMRLDTPGSSLTSSTDPTGGSEDYNHFVRKGPKGWMVLADLKGPGVLTRLWLTGVNNGSQRVRFYFDGAWRPTLELTLDELTGAREPFVAPVAAYENDAWYSLVPMPYRRRLVVMIEDGHGRESGWSRLSYQVNHTRLPRELRIKSFSGVVTDEDRAALRKLADAWRSYGRPGHVPGTRVSLGALLLQPGESRWMDPIRGPAVIRRLSVATRFDRSLGMTERQDVLRDVVMKIKWDQSVAPSVVVPLGDFFGSVWNRVRFRSAFLSLSDDTWVCDFPMPFHKEAEITLENQGIHPVEVEIEAQWEPMGAQPAGIGYFHSTWSGSTPDDVGRPHDVLDVQGRGKFVGCVVGSCSKDREWGILGGDELIYVDGASSASWRGTALDHYFSVGRTFQGPVAGPLHGTLFRTFFGSVQYRFHMADAVTFDRSLKMVIERGASGSSHAWIQSVAYYYMEHPMAAAFPLRSTVRRSFPRNPLAEATIMAELLNYERIGDHQGAREHISNYLARFPNSRYAAILRLRQIAYTEALSGYDAAWPLYQQFLADETDSTALAQARLLAWFLEHPEHALLSLYSSGQSSAVLNGTTVCTVDGPERVSVVGVKVKPGQHCLAVQASGQPQPNWVQACLKMRRSNVTTQDGWTYAFDAPGDWGSPGYNERNWRVLDRTGTVAPPEAPFLWIEPNAFVGMQSKAVGLRPGDKEWPDRQSKVIFRKEFNVR